MKLKVIIPNSGMDRDTLNKREEMLLKYAMPNTEISVDCISGGPESIESAYDEILAGPYILEGVRKAETDGYDAIIIYCGSDPAVSAAREIANIPVIGPGKASQLVALSLGHKFSVLTVLDGCIPRDEEAVYEKGIGFDRLASVRSIGIPVSDVRGDMDATFEALRLTGKKCIEEDGAQCLVLSCLGMAGMGERLTEALGIPVLDPAPISVKWAEMLVATGLTQSRFAYPSPPDKIRL